MSAALPAPPRPRGSSWNRSFNHRIIESQNLAKLTSPAGLCSLLNPWTGV